VVVEAVDEIGVVVLPCVPIVEPPERTSQYQEIVVLTDRHRRSPAVPAIAAQPGVEGGSQQSQHDDRTSHIQ